MIYKNYLNLRSYLRPNLSLGYAYSGKMYWSKKVSFHDAITKGTCCWHNSLLIHAEGLIYQMICVQVQVNYSICIVDHVQLPQWDKIVFFWHMRSWNWFVVPSASLSVLSAVLVKLAWDTVVFVKHGFGWRTEVYVLLSVEETDVSKIFHLHL